MDQAELIQRILEMPGKINAQQILVMDISGSVEILKAIPEKIKSLHYEKILHEKEGGKPKYSNQDIRDIALNKILDEDQPYEQAISIFEQKERVLKLAQIELDFLHNTFKALLAVAGMK